MTDALYCTSMGHGNEPAAGVVRLGDTQTDHPYCQACIDTLRTNSENTLLRMLVDTVNTVTADSIAAAFHEAYERLAPSFGYKTRDESAVPWEQVPEANRRLMCAVVEDLMSQDVIAVVRAAP